MVGRGLLQLEDGRKVGLEKRWGKVSFRAYLPPDREEDGKGRGKGILRGTM